MLLSMQSGRRPFRLSCRLPVRQQLQHSRHVLYCPSREVLGLRHSATIDKSEAARIRALAGCRTGPGRRCPLRLRRVDLLLRVGVASDAALHALLKHSRKRLVVVPAKLRFLRICPALLRAFAADEKMPMTLPLCWPPSGRRRDASCHYFSTSVSWPAPITAPSHL